jgi:Mn-dependent DtxR family transcriptional regulator
VIFADALAHSLVWTAQDLRKERANITVEEIAHLLDVSPEHAARLLTA